jgi:NADH-quinone oxidoreductase subunit H
MTGWEVFLEAAIKVVVAFALLLVNTLLLVWFERKVVSDMQNRVGPNRAGPYGVLQTVADGLKLFFKESMTPRKVEFVPYIVAPVAALLPALLIFLVIPIGRPFTLGDRQIELVGMDLNVGILYILALSSLAVYAVVLAGWSSGSKYPLLGAVRASAQMISYEAAMGLALVPLIFYTGSASLTTIVEGQAGSLLGFIPAWNVVLVPSFLIFFIAGVAETNRAPFDLVEAEQEIVGGYHTEYSGLRFALFFLAEYINMFNISAITVALFLGGWNGPDFGLPGAVAWIMPIVWFLLKTYVLLFVFVWIRASLPRMRYDQLMTFGWKRLIPLTLLWIVAATVAIGIRRFPPSWWPFA